MEENKENTQESKKTHHYYELLKYPVVTICIVLGTIAISKYVGKIARISTSGVEFAVDQTKDAVLEVNDTIAKLQSQLAFLMRQNRRSQNGLLRSSSSESEEEVWGESETETLMRTEIVNNSMGRLGLTNTNEASLRGQTGYIWLGEYKDQSWKTDPILRDLESMKRIETAPDQIQTQIYFLDKNIKLRLESSNSNNSRTLGVIPEKTRVYLKSIELKDNNQYWGLVEVDP